MHQIKINNDTRYVVDLSTAPATDSTSYQAKVFAAQIKPLVELSDIESRPGRFDHPDAFVQHYFPDYTITVWFEFKSIQVLTIQTE